MGSLFCSVVLFSIHLPEEKRADSFSLVVWLSMFYVSSSLDHGMAFPGHTHFFLCLVCSFGMA